jgi:hypothetical protein
MTDWYFTDTGRLRGFIARPVVGGVYIPMLGDATLWRKWAARGAHEAGPWAPAPIAAWSDVAATSEKAPQAWRRHAADPAPEGWTAPGFDDAAWPEQPGAFGGGRVFAGDAPKSSWAGRPVLIRRRFTIEGVPPRHPRLRACYSGPTEVYLNGVLALRVLGDVRGYQNLPLRPEAVRTLHPGPNTLAVVSRAVNNPKATKFLDVGLVDLHDPPAPTAD